MYGYGGEERARQPQGTQNSLRGQAIRHRDVGCPGSPYGLLRPGPGEEDWSGIERQESDGVPAPESLIRGPEGECGRGTRLPPNEFTENSSGDLVWSSTPITPCAVLSVQRPARPDVQGVRR